MKKTTLFLLLSISTIGPAWGGTLYRSENTRPKWISKPPESRQYYSFVGLSSGAENVEAARRRAFDAAYQQVIAQIGVEISGKFSSREEDLDEKSSLKIVNEVDSKFRGNINQVQVVDSYYEENQSKPGQKLCDYWMLVKVPKKIVEAESSRLAKESQLAREQFQTDMAEAKRLLELGDERKASDAAVKALLSVESSFGCTDSVNEAKSFLKKMYSELDLTPENDGQSGGLRKGLPKPLVVSVSSGGQNKPVTDWPITFLFVDSGGKLDGRVQSDVNGKAYCSVNGIEKSGKSIKLAAFSDGSILLAGLSESDENRVELENILRQKTTNFTVSSLSEERSELSQLVVDGDWTRSEVELILETLGKIGYNVKQEAIVNKDYWKENLEPDVKWVVFLNNEVAQYDRYGSLEIAVIKASVAIKKVEGDSVLSPTDYYVCTSKGGGRNRSSAFDKAMGDAAGLISTHIQTSFP